MNFTSHDSDTDKDIDRILQMAADEEVEGTARFTSPVARDQASSSARPEKRRKMSVSDGHSPDNHRNGAQQLTEKRIYNIIYKELRTNVEDETIKALHDLETLCTQGPIEERRSNKHILRRIGAHSVLLHVLHLRKDSLSVQTQGIGTLLTFLIGDRELKEELAKAFAVETVVEAMVQYPESENLQESAIAFLFPFVELPQVLEQEGVRGVAAAMKAHPSNTQIQRLGCQLLKKVLKTHPEGKNAILGASCLSALCGVIETGVADENLLDLLKKTVKEIMG